MNVLCLLRIHSWRIHAKRNPRLYMNSLVALMESKTCGEFTAYKRVCKRCGKTYQFPLQIFANEWVASVLSRKIGEKRAD
jgi:ribosomal protein L32